MVKKTIEEIYKKQSLHESILERGDVYVGSNELISEDMFIFEEETQTIIKKNIKYNPALLKIFDEVLVNAIDHSVREKDCTYIKVNITNTQVTVENNGPGIPIVKHKEHDIYIPEMIFGNLLTSSNYNDSEERSVGGRFGLGSKLCNIYSKKFTVNTVDHLNKLSYIQEFEENMYKKSEPIIKKCTKKPFTAIIFIPDFKRFGIKEFTKDIIALMKKRVYDCIACTNKNVNVYLNDVKLKQKDFQNYTQLYSKAKFIHERFEKDDIIWEYSVIPSEQFEQVSFVNGISTINGGSHTADILNQITKKLTEMIQLKKKISNVKPSYIKDHLFLFVKSTIINPKFSNQCKDTLTSLKSTFFGKNKNIKIEVSDEFIGKLYKSGIVEDIISFTKFKDQKDLEKGPNTSRKTTLRNIPKLDDAINAGTSKSKNCTLILTEGDSAKSFAISGLGVIGRDNYGVFPLRGKVLNIREATQKQLLENKEINYLKQIIGLKTGTVYKNTDSLRYGSIILLVDQDSDGSHIKCLLINMFHTWWPELLNVKGFIRSMKTPIVKVSKGKDIISFYTIKDFTDWEKSTNNSSKWNIKYYKGLGTSTAKEAKEIFKNMKNNIINYTSDSKTDHSILLAFEKKQADSRKEWLQNYNFDMVLDQADSDISYNDLFNKELIHFSMNDVIRSIPSICDGLKPSQRKVLYTMFLKNYKSEIKVAQLGASVSELTSYHHGEASLFGTIINMAGNYTGSNNINLLKPNGQFGSRLTSNGKDAASPRYIFTELNDITNSIFKNEDTYILQNQEEDNQVIEPYFYVPVLPMILINGTIGIGTGYSTNIPCYNPKDLINNIKNYLTGSGFTQLIPWYRGFKGSIVEDSNNPGNFIMHGIYNINTSKKYINITELPIGIGFDDYKEYLESLIESNYNISDIKNYSTEEYPNFEIYFNTNEILNKFVNHKDFTKILKLSKNISTRNYHLINQNGTITHYDSAEDILSEFISIRLEYNIKRKDYLLAKYKHEYQIYKNKIRFLTDIMEDKLTIYKKSKIELNELLEYNTYSKIDNTFNYLIDMPISSFTKEKLKEIQHKYDTVKNLYELTKTKTKTSILIEDLEIIEKQY